MAETYEKRARKKRKEQKRREKAEQKRIQKEQGPSDAPTEVEITDICHDVPEREDDGRS